LKEPRRCTVCEGTAATPFLRIEDLPVSCNHICSNYDAALAAPKATICLSFCPDCGHVFNSEYGSAHIDYRPGYESSLSGSERFREYDDALVSSLVERYDLRRRVIIEIGCGRGQFLRALCERGRNCGIGFDPSYTGCEKDASPIPGVVIHREAYGAQNNQPSADFICSRHTLEHIGEPRRFLSDIRNAAARPGVPVFFELPNGLYTLRDGGIWDIIYEHCSYFTPASLVRLFCEAGYEPVEVAETFGGQFLTLHARTGCCKQEQATAVSDDLHSLVRKFAESYRRKLNEWQFRLRKLHSEGRKVVVWGAGAKATTFLNLLQPTAIDYVVDVNPRKQGNYVIGTGQRIVAPEFLREVVADEIICMNPNYLNEIAFQVYALGLDDANILSG
jgi:SAM-dependent methyltransferase